MIDYLLHLNSFWWIIPGQVFRKMLKIITKQIPTEKTQFLYKAQKQFSYMSHMS